MNHAVSVVIPTFQRPGPLKEAIESVLAQPVDVDIIVVDDSPDCSAERVVAAFGNEPVRYLANPHPTGGWPSRVRNLGLPLARAPLVHFLDDDDRVTPGHYVKAIDTFALHPEVGVVFGVIAPFSPSGDAISLELNFFADSARRARAAARLGPKLGFAIQMFFHPTLLVCSAAVLRTEAVRTAGGFDPNAKLVEDVEFHARMMRRFGAFFLDQPVLEYRIGPGLMHTNPSQEEVGRTYRLMHQRYRRDYGACEFYALKALARSVGRLM